MTKVAIIGKGNVGSALKRGLERAGHEVRAVGKDPDAVAETARWGDVVVLAVPFPEVGNAVNEIGDAANGKPLLDVTNAVTEDYEFAIESTATSGAEELRKKLPDAKVVKSFNHTFAKYMDKGEVNGERITLFVASDHGDARDAIRDLGRDLGFDPVDSGGLKNARWMEAMGYFNMQLSASRDTGEDWAFKLVH